MSTRSSSDATQPQTQSEVDSQCDGKWTLHVRASFEAVRPHPQASCEVVHVEKGSLGGYLVEVNVDLDPLCVGVVDHGAHRGEFRRVDDKVARLVMPTGAIKRKSHTVITIQHREIVKNLHHIHDHATHSLLIKSSYDEFECLLHKHHECMHTGRIHTCHSLRCSLPSLSLCQRDYNQGRGEK